MIKMKNKITFYQTIRLQMIKNDYNIKHTVILILWFFFLCMNNIFVDKYSFSKHEAV
jgi:hypothetical protein